MTRIRRTISLTVTGLVLASRISAQTQVTATLTQPYAPNAAAVTAFGYYMSPYTGTVDGTVQRFNCVDFFHEVWLGDVWQANQVNLGLAGANLNLLSTTRDGNALYGGSLANALDLYREMAWLTDQQPLNPGASGASALTATAIQTAIWALGSPGYETNAGWGINALDQYSQLSTAAFTTPSNDPNTTAYWIGQAQTLALSSSLINSGYYYRFNVLTNTNLLAEHGAQEFIYSVPANEVGYLVATPEPATLFLVGSGFVGMLGVASRRRKRTDSRSH